MKERSWTKEEFELTVFATVLASEEGFLVDLETRVLKESSNNEIFEHILKEKIRRKFEESAGTRLKRKSLSTARPQ